MAKRGRPLALTEIKRAEILAILAVGCSRRTAAKYVGCAISTIQNTADRDSKFAGQLRQAEQQAEIGYLKSIQQAARKEQYWRAAAWALERKNPEEYALRSRDLVRLSEVKLLFARFAEDIVRAVPLSGHRKGVVKVVHSFYRRLQRFARKDTTDEPDPEGPADERDGN